MDLQRPRRKRAKPGKLVTDVNLGHPDIGNDNMALNCEIEDDNDPITPNPRPR